jgi:hypothetical protein
MSNDSEFRDKLRSLSFGRRIGQSERVVLHREDNERPGEQYARDAEGRPISSVETRHWDGSVDTTVMAPCLTAKLTLEG